MADLVKAIKPRCLALTHFSSRYDSPEAEITVGDLQKQVAEADATCKVLAAEDLQRVDIPAREL